MFERIQYIYSALGLPYLNFILLYLIEYFNVEDFKVFVTTFIITNFWEADVIVSLVTSRVALSTLKIDIHRLNA